MNVARTTYRTALVAAALSCIGYAQLAHADHDDGDRGRWTEGRGENGRGYYAPDRGRWDGDRDGRYGGPPGHRPPGWNSGWRPGWAPAPSWYYSRPYPPPRYYGPPPPRWRPYPPPPPVYYVPYPRGYWPGSYYGPSYAYPRRGWDGDVSLTIRFPL
jgi:hypothetical protein